jgi:hypothetical protein
MAADPGHAAALRCLYAAAIGLSRQHGIHSWLGLVEANGSRASDAVLVQRVVEAHGLMLRPAPLRAREPVAWFDEESYEQPSAYSATQLRALALPARIRSFARVLRARAVGVPTRHPS